ncbi:SGNH/GDSL hydrolase family protein [Patulibacter sp.]|uniref:SGNH/GDSL hydrolase family protein n=1 Tax=Patulibacter sp. TaxID=1912859 RepID=UPI002719933D|nr:SGNH/GDSL hydrolase family protein [Patulibacter sp.]MDO9406769.1 SGNH/GDSL hydrolase family protein [Patulibacter sp.]
MPLRPTRPTILLAVLLALGWIAAGRVAEAAGEEYVALGDSYSSGLGTGAYVDRACRRSSTAFPDLVAAARPGTTLTSVACAGATTADVLADQLGALTPSTGLVTITIGGNDAGFTGVLVRCALPMWAARCGPPVGRARTTIRRSLPARLDRVYGEIRRRAPAAVVVVVGYPRLFNGIDCGAATFFSRGDQRLLDGAAELLRDVTRARARAAGFRFADVVPAFRGHAVCDDAEWLNGLSSPLRESFHPNAAGHAEGYAPAVLRAAG